MAVRFFGRLRDALPKLEFDPEFTCGDCDIQARCGRLPSRDCPDKLAQLEQSDGYNWRLRRATRSMKGVLPVIYGPGG
jgi:hypothetical protein